MPCRTRILSLGTLLVAMACVDDVASPRARDDLALSFPNLHALQRAAGLGPRVDTLDATTGEPATVALDQGSHSRFPLVVAAAPVGAPPEFNIAPTIESITVDVWFEPGRANARARMVSWGNRARLGVILEVIENSRSVASTPQSAQLWTSYLPMRRSYEVSTFLGVSKNCGLSAYGNGTGTAYHEFLVDGIRWFQWGHDERTARTQATQPACTSTTVTDPASGGSNGSWTICYYVIWTDQYGNFLGRELLYCAKF